MRIISLHIAHYHDYCTQSAPGQVTYLVFLEYTLLYKTAWGGGQPSFAAITSYVLNLYMWLPLRNSGPVLLAHIAHPNSDLKAYPQLSTLLWKNGFGVGVEALESTLAQVGPQPQVRACSLVQVPNFDGLHCASYVSVKVLRRV